MTSEQNINEAVQGSDTDGVEDAVDHAHSDMMNRSGDPISLGNGRKDKSECGTTIVTKGSDGSDREAQAHAHSVARKQADVFAALALRVAEHQDKAAFAELFDHFAPRLKAYLLRLGAQSGQAEELVQEVMITLWRKAELFDAKKSSLATWLFRIARNRRIDALRKEKRSELDPDEPMLHPEGEMEAGVMMDAQLRDERVRAALQTLPEEQMTLVRMAFFQALSHSQISEETGLPLGTVKSRIRLAFSRLRRTLEQDEAVDTDL